jgi:hypothetical protein
MSLSIHDRHLVDRYLNGELSGLELEEFKARLNADKEFHSAVELQQLIYSGISYAREEELRLRIRSAINYRKSNMPFSLKLIIVFMVILFLGITFWSYLGNEFEKMKPYNNFISLFKSHRKQSSIETKKQSNVLKRDANIKERDTAIDTAIEDTSFMTMDSAATFNASEEDIEVKKDIMVASRLIAVIDKGDEKGTSLSNDVAQKLPDADLPTEERVDTFTVEFWVSPIHYRGYKMSKSKLVLFGIENFEDVTLYRVNKAMYFNYEESWFSLATTYDFTPYQKLNETEIPQDLK